MAEGGREAPRRQSRWLHRLGGAIARRPRRAIAGWLLLLALLGVLSTDLDERVSTRAIFIDGSAAKREHEIAVRRFGSETAVVVLLRGPSAEVKRQGKRLERWYGEDPATLVVSPWTAGGAIDGLRPSPGEAALVVNVRGDPDDDVTEILPRIEQGVEEVVAAPVRVSVAGAPAVVDSIQTANERAVALGQLISFPALIIILLLVFRSVFAAAIPIVVGGAVVVASRGVLDLVARVVHVELLAVGAMGMMALALGVDYALLIVSRFREEIAKGADVPTAVATTTATTGRTVLMAGGGLSLAMLVSPLVLTGDIVVSISFAVLIATVLSVASAIFVVPALLAILGTRLDRWSLPRRERKEGLAASLSARLSAHPRRVILPIALFLALASAWAFTLDTGALAIAQLPPGDSGRVQQEEVQRALGPGWVAPLEIAIEDGTGPVTTPERMRDLVAFQRRLERDPGVATVSDVAAMAAAAKGLEGIEPKLAAQERSLAKLDSGLSRLHDGARLSTARLRAAAAGAERLDSALGATGSGAEALSMGLGAVAQGSARMTTGLDRAGGGSGELAEGTAEASKGAEGLAAGLARAGEQTDEIESSAAVVEDTMEKGQRRLGEADAAIAAVDSSLGGALGALRAMTVGKDDPRYQAVLEQVEASLVRLGRDPETGEDTGAADSVTTTVRRAEGQFDLGQYLAGQLERNGEQASEGVAKLAEGSAKLDAGLRRLEEGAADLSTGIMRLADGGEALSPALLELRDGAERLDGGLGMLAQGAAGFASGLGTGSEQSELLVAGLDRVGSGVERQRRAFSLDRIRDRAPGFFRSGYLYLAGLDGAPPERRRQAGSLVSLQHGGTAARLLVISRFDPADPRSKETRGRIEDDARALAERTGAEVVVGGPTATQQDIDTALRAQTPLARLALAAVTALILIMVLRALVVPFIAGLLNLLTVAATFGILAVLFDSSLLGGPGYVDTTVLPATIVVIFGLAIDYEVFIFSRMREEYLRSGSTKRAIAEGVTRTAPVVTGAALVMIVVFLSFSLSSFSLMRNFGVAQAIGVAIDAFLIRLLVIPALMQMLGGWAWWMPGWLDRRLPGTSNSAATKAAAA